LENVIDLRQKKKAKHKMGDIIAIVFFAQSTRVEGWEEIEYFGHRCEDFLREHLELTNGISSHDTIERVIAMVSPEFLQKFRDKWNEEVSKQETEKIRQLLSIDGKTQRGNGNVNQNANHVVTAINEGGISIGEKLVKSKENEIKAIPELLDMLNIKNHIITIDAIGTQVDIVKRIRDKTADYVLALKGNQHSLHEDVRDYFADLEFLKKCDYAKTIEKARSGLETREYWQTDNIAWLPQKSRWHGLKTVGVTKNTIVKRGVKTEEMRCFISSLGVDAKEFGRCVRSHWKVESFHWHLDVTFREDADHTLEKQAAFNLNIIRKLALSVLKLYDLKMKKGMSLKAKRYVIGLDPVRALREIMAL
jgi:predicted transposase YbfD/YdcC